jgi:hypothetical protein
MTSPLLREEGPGERFHITIMLRMLFLTAVITSLFLTPPAHAAPDPDRGVFLPFITAANGAVCAPVPGQSYGALNPAPPPTGRPAALHADLNLALRGYVATTGYLGLVDYGGTADAAAPQLGGLFGDRRAPTFTGVYQVRDWDWDCNCRAAPITSPPVTLATLAATSGEPVLLPDSGYTVGSGYEALVLYAAADRITLKYTRDDNVVLGYTLHIEGLCVAPDLLALYQVLDAAGRVQLPALRAGAALGRAAGPVGVAIRDNGAFLDPRSRKDWWHGY